MVQEHCISCGRVLCGLLLLISQTDFATILDAKLAAYLQRHLNPYQILNASIEVPFAMARTRENKIYCQPSLRLSQLLLPAYRPVLRICR